MSTIAVATTAAYRAKVASAAAEGGLLPKASYLAFGSGDTPYSIDDTALENEWLRVPTTNTATGPLLTVTGVLLGAEAGLNVLREIGVVCEDGTLMGRRVISHKELEPETRLEFEITFQY